MSLISLENVEKTYSLGKTKVKALKGISLTLNHSEIVGLVGPSGSGKSTLLNLLGCIDVPTTGHITIDGLKINSMNDEQLTRMRRSKIGFIFQDFNLIPVLTAFENIELPLILAGMRKSDRERKVKEMLGWLGLEEFSRHKPDELSGGQRQRVAVCRALVSNPGIVLADEPTANLDWENGVKVLEAMRVLSEKTRALIIISTHDPRVLPYIDRKVVLDDGRIQSIESTEEPKVGALSSVGR